MTQLVPSPRECDCPEWVTRCAHIAAKILCYSPRPSVMPCPCALRDGVAFVVYDRSCVGPCPVNGSLTHVEWERRHYAGNSEAAALAAFHAAEAELLALPSDAPVDGEELWDAWLHARSVSR